VDVGEGDPIVMLNGNRIWLFCDSDSWHRATVSSSTTVGDFPPSSSITRFIVAAPRSKQANNQLIRGLGTIPAAFQVEMSVINVAVSGSSVRLSLNHIEF
jgi:hypothetical protein